MFASTNMRKKQNAIHTPSVFYLHDVLELFFCFEIVDVFQKSMQNLMVNNFTYPCIVIIYFGQQSQVSSRTTRTLCVLWKMEISS